MLEVKGLRNIGTTRDDRDGSHRELKSAVNNYAARINDPSLRWLFGLAEKFHRNLYNNTMPQFEIDSDRHDLALFVRRMVDLTRTAGG